MSFISFLPDGRARASSTVLTEVMRADILVFFLILGGKYPALTIKYDVSSGFIFECPLAS